MKGLALEIKAEIAAYLREHPGVTSEPGTTRELQIERSTVRRCDDEIRAEFQRR